MLVSDFSAVWPDRKQHSFPFDEMSMRQPSIIDQLVWRGVIGPANLLLAGPAVAVGESVVLPLAFLVCVNHSILLKLNQAALRVPRPRADRQDNIIS